MVTYDSKPPTRPLVFFRKSLAWRLIAKNLCHPPTNDLLNWLTVHRRIRMKKTISLALFTALFVAACSEPEPPPPRNRPAYQPPPDAYPPVQQPFQPPTPTPPPPDYSAAQPSPSPEVAATAGAVKQTKG